LNKAIFTVSKLFDQFLSKDHIFFILTFFIYLEKMNVLKNNSSQECARKKITSILKKGHENGVKQLNGLLFYWGNLLVDFFNFKGRINDVEMNKRNKFCFLDSTTTLSKKRRFERENCNDIQFLENNNLLKHEMIEDGIVETPKTSSKKGLIFDTCLGGTYLDGITFLGQKISKFFSLKIIFLFISNCYILQLRLHCISIVINIVFVRYFNT
jgi:hypothetical protein